MFLLSNSSGSGVLFADRNTYTWECINRPTEKFFMLSYRLISDTPLPEQHVFNICQQNSTPLPKSFNSLLLPSRHLEDRLYWIIAIIKEFMTVFQTESHEISAPWNGMNVVPTYILPN